MTDAQKLDIIKTLLDDGTGYLPSDTTLNTYITLAQPSAHDGAGGYSTTGSTINFMIVHPSAVMQSTVLYSPRIFSPDVFQEANAWAYDFRLAHGAWVKHQKANGIYVSAASFPSA